MRRRGQAIYHQTRAAYWLGWLLAKWDGLDTDERALGRQAVRSHLLMSRALRSG